METWAIVKDDNILCHYGVKGMKWHKHLFGKKPDPMYGTAYKLRGGPVIDQKRAMGGTALVNDRARLRRQGGVGAEAENALKKQRQTRTASAAAANEMSKSADRRESKKRKKGAAQTAADNQMAKAFEIRRKKEAESARKKNAARAKASNEAANQNRILREKNARDFERRLAEEEKRARSAPKRARQQRSAYAQSETIKAGQQQVRSMLDAIHKKQRSSKAARAKAQNEIAKGRKFIEKAMNATRQERLKREATRGAYGDSKPLRPVSLSEPFKAKRKKR